MKELYIYRDVLYEDSDELDEQIDSYCADEGYLTEESIMNELENEVYVITNIQELLDYADGDSNKVKEYINDYGLEWLGELE